MPLAMAKGNLMEATVPFLYELKDKWPDFSYNQAFEDKWVFFALNDTANISLTKQVIMKLKTTFL